MRRTRAADFRAALSEAPRMCGQTVIFVFRVTPRYLADRPRRTTDVPTVMSVVMSIRFLVRYNNSVFASPAVVPDFASIRPPVSWPGSVSSVPNLVFAPCPYARYPLSTSNTGAYAGSPTFSTIIRAPGTYAFLRLRFALNVISHSIL